MAPRSHEASRRSTNGQNASFPTQQMFVLALCRICEPIAFMSIFPYIYYLVESFGIASSASKIAVYAGMVTSSFAFAEFSTGVLWGRLSDRVGRKPVLIGGLIGTAISMVMFGFSTNLPMALVARALGGLLNGNIGVLQTTVAELVTNKEHQPRAYSIMPFVWGLGSIIGPALGGALYYHKPASDTGLMATTESSSNKLFERFPALLANLVCTVILLVGIAIGFLFLKETHPDKRHREDYGLKLGNSLLAAMRLTPSASTFRAPAKSIQGKEAEAGMYIFDEQMLEAHDPPPAYRTNENTPRSSHSAHRDLEIADAAPKERRAKKAFTKQIILIIITYGLLAYHAISFDQLMPVFLSSPISQEPVELPFHFSGGFALSTKTIGIMLSIQGFYSMACQIFLFPIIVKRIGALTAFRVTVISWSVLYLLVPYLVLLPKGLQMPGAMLCLLWRITAQTLTFPNVQILLANNAPSTLVLGLINGVAASIASLSRAFGPTMSGVLHAWGLSHGYNGLAFWAAGMICVIGAVESMWIADSSEAKPGEEKQEESDEEEALTGAPALDAALSAVSKSSDNLLALASQEE